MTEFTHRIRYSETDHTGRLSMQGLLRLFQDLNYLGAEDADRGIAYQDAHGAAWYLLAWDVHATRMPCLSETVTFTSRFYHMAGALAKKYMTLTNTAGDVLAYALTSWAYVNRATGEPLPFPDGYWEGEEILPLPAAYGQLTRVRAGKTVRTLSPVIVGDILIDENGHVNNVRFSELALSLLSHDTGAHLLRAAFIRESRRGDILTPEISGTEASPVLAFRAQDGEIRAIFSAE